MTEARVSTWNELQDRLFEESWNPELQRFRPRYAFRGLSLARYRLETSLMRMGGDYAGMEQHLLRNFRKYGHRHLGDGASVWDLVSLAQHYGLPTRLLDWTHSPFVALHFATASLARMHEDGAVWAVHYDRAHERLPERLRAALRAEGASLLTVEMLAKNLGRLGELAGLQPEPFCMFFEPASVDDRIVNQMAIFSVVSDPRVALDDWLESHPGLHRKIVIPASLKWEIRDKLDQANVTERVLFPGLEGLSRWLRRHYSPKDAPPLE